MRALFVGTILLALVAIPAGGQTKSESKCSLQELAIDAALGDAEAQHMLGVEFHRGVVVPQDLGKAATMWRLASNAGVIEAHNNLGYLTYYGKGVKQDHAEGIRLWRVAAEKGFAESQIHIADAYSDGKHLPRDYVEAYAWATAGKHYAAKIEDAQVAKQVMVMAEKTLAAARQGLLLQAQLSEAEKKAAVYIENYGPK